MWSPQDQKVDHPVKKLDKFWNPFWDMNWSIYEKIYFYAFDVENQKYRSAQLGVYETFPNFAWLYLPPCRKIIWGTIVLWKHWSIEKEGLYTIMFQTH